MRKRSMVPICLAVMLLCASCGNRHPQETREAEKELQELNEAETNVSTQKDSAEEEQEQVKETAEKKEMSSGESGQEESVPENEISGLLMIGNQGSAITMYDDGTADYYWIEGGGVKTDNVWSTKDNVLTIQVPSLNCDIYAEWDGKNNTLIFQSDSLNWEEEEFVAVSQIQKKPTAEEYRQVILAVYEQMAKKNAASEESGADSSEPAAATSGDVEQSPLDEEEAAGISSGDVDPDLKAFLDEYEAFMDDYVEFMKKYKESGSSVEMLSDYMAMMQRYADFVSAAEKYNSEEMSAADAAYYLDVTTRVSKKMLEVAY